MDWKPISTAPKDGTVMLLYLSQEPDQRSYVVPDTAKHYTIGFWQHRDWRSIETEDCGMMGGELTGWMSDIVCVPCKPTHWAELDPPSDA